MTEVLINVNWFSSAMVILFNRYKKAMVDEPVGNYDIEPFWFGVL